MPLESNVKFPVAPAVATGSWIKLSLVEMLAPEIDSTPAAVDDTDTPVIPADVNAPFNSFTYCESVVPGIRFGAAVVAVLPSAVKPVMVKLDPALTVPMLLPLVPKS